MDIRLIFSDIDNTVLPKSQIVSGRTRAAIAACRKKGVEFIVASGRWFPSARQVVSDQLGIEDGYMITCNGTVIVKTDGSILKEYCMTDAQARRVYEILHRENVMMSTYVDGALCRLRRHLMPNFHFPEQSSRIFGKDYIVTDDDEDMFVNVGMRHPYKMEAYSEDTQLLARLRAQLRAEGLQVNSAYPVNLEVMAPGTGKGVAVKWMAEHMGVGTDQTMGFGDYFNDLEMLGAVGWPVAVENAADEVKQVARLVAPACADDGVARTIEDYVLGDKNI